MDDKKYCYSCYIQIKNDKYNYCYECNKAILLNELIKCTSNNKKGNRCGNYTNGLKCFFHKLDI